MAQQYVIRESKNGKTAYGANMDFFRYQGPESIIHGPAETGKTFALCLKVHLCACKYPGANIALVRKTQTSLYSTILQTFMNKILGNVDQWPCIPYGGLNKPERFNYTNGSVVWLAGLDKASRLLSSEFDIIAISQTEELELDDWETLTTRTTGRAGNMPYAQTIGDANPSYPAHWMYKREAIRMFYSQHTDNPALYDQKTGEITKQGQKTISILQALTGTRRQRLYEGKPAQAEGVIYEEWNEAAHYIYADKAPMCQRYVAAQDWGYTHPGVLGVWAVDGDGRMYLVAQIYRTKKTVNWWKKRAIELNNEFNLEVIACGPDQPAYIEEYQRAGLNAIPANNAVLPGINAVQQMLKPGDDGKPRLYIVRDSLRHPDQDLIDAKRPHKVEDEFPAYVWANSKAKETPVKELDDGMDMTRYGAMYVSEPIMELEIVRLG